MESKCEEKRRRYYDNALHDRQSSKWAIGGGGKYVLYTPTHLGILASEFKIP